MSSDLWPQKTRDIAVANLTEPNRTGPDQTGPSRKRIIKSNSRVANMTKKEVKEKCSTHKGKWLEPFRRSFVRPDRSILNVFGAGLRRARIIERKTLGEQLRPASQPECYKSPFAVARLAYLLLASFFQNRLPAS